MTTVGDYTLPGAAIWVMSWLYISQGSTRLDDLAKRVFAEDSWLSKHLAFATTAPLMFIVPRLISPEEAGLRGVAVVAVPYYVLRASQTFYEKRFRLVEPAARRLHTGIVYQDLRLCKLDISDERKWTLFRASMLHALQQGLLCAGCVAALSFRGALPRPLAFATGAVAGALYLLTSLGVLDGIVGVYTSLMNVEVPHSNKSPLRAQTLAEFWAHRWNQVVQEILQTYVYLPLRAHLGVSRSAAILATFTVSGLIHTPSLIVAGLSAEHTIMMASYFVLQAGLLFAEQAMGVSQWKSEVARRAWTLAALGIPLPLIVAPTLTLVGDAL